MANRNNNASQENDASKIVRPKAIHSLWNWLSDEAAGNSDAQFAATVLDVSRGTKVIASILCEHATDSAAQLDDPENNQTLLSSNDTEALARLMVFSLDRLYMIAENRVEHFNSKAEKEARA